MVLNWVKGRCTYGIRHTLGPKPFCPRIEGPYKCGIWQAFGSKFFSSAKQIVSYTCTFLVRPGLFQAIVASLLFYRPGKQMRLLATQHMPHVTGVGAIMTTHVKLHGHWRPWQCIDPSAFSPCVFPVRLSVHRSFIIARRANFSPTQLQ